MKYKCKICPRKMECDKKQKEEHLMWRPFENLKEIIKEKGVKIYDNRA